MRGQWRVSDLRLPFQAEEDYKEVIEYLAASNGNHRQSFSKGCAMQLADKLAQLGVGAAAEEDLPLLARRLLILLVCVKAFAGTVLQPEQRSDALCMC